MWNPIYNNDKNNNKFLDENSYINEKKSNNNLDIVQNNDKLGSEFNKEINEFQDDFISHNINNSFDEYYSEINDIDNYDSQNFHDERSSKELAQEKEELETALRNLNNTYNRN